MHKHRSLRGALTSRTKEALFSVFGEIDLPPISTNATPREIHLWKKSPSIKQCYEKLEQQINKDGGLNTPTYISRILEKVWPDSSLASNKQVAYAVSVCHVILDPTNDNIQITKSIIESKMKRNLVSITKF